MSGEANQPQCHDEHLCFALQQEELGCRYLKRITPLAPIPWILQAPPWFGGGPSFPAISIHAVTEMEEGVGVEIASGLCSGGSMQRDWLAGHGTWEFPSPKECSEK